MLLECNFGTEHELAGVRIVELNQVDIGLWVITRERSNGEEVTSDTKYLEALDIAQRSKPLLGQVVLEAQGLHTQE